MADWLGAGLLIASGMAATGAVLLVLSAASPRRFEQLATYLQARCEWGPWWLEAMGDIALLILALVVLGSMGIQALSGH